MPKVCLISRAGLLVHIYALYYYDILLLMEKHIIVPNAYESHITTTCILSIDNFWKMCGLIFFLLFLLKVRQEAKNKNLCGDLFQGKYEGKSNT